jgi:hypothetical protein
VHRKQITFKWLNTETGEVRRGRIPALREAVRQFLVPFKGLDAHFALEATTGWRFVAEELSRAGLTAHLAEAAETATLRGTKRRAKTDRRDCDHMVDLLASARLPESWLPPEHVLEIRTLVRLRKDLGDARRFGRAVQVVEIPDLQEEQIQELRQEIVEMPPALREQLGRWFLERRNARLRAEREAVEARVKKMLPPAEPDGDGAE